MICRGELDVVKFCFMMLRHTKFDPDAILAQIAHRFYKTDIFNA